MPFEPLTTTDTSLPSPNAPASRFVPLREEQPVYNALSSGDDDHEMMQFQNHDKPVKAPKGTGAFFTEIEEDDVFDTPSGVFEEAAAQFEVQAAWASLLANAYGLVPDDEINEFVADRSRALASAQRRQPEYMKEFQRQFDDAEGFFETAGVFLSNPRAIGRTAITQSPNSAIPLITTYLGAKGGAATGAAVGVAAGNATGVGVAAPEELITAPAGATVGAVIGGGVGAFAGGTLVEVGAEIDGMIKEAGFDTSDPAQVLAALQNDELMNTIRAKAERKGITTASVDALFQFFGGRFVKAAKNAGRGTKVAATAADVGVQSVGEGAGEAAGQFAKDGEVNWKEAALEAVTSIAQSGGQTAIGATVDGSKEAAAAINKKAVEKQQQILDTLTPEATDIVAQYEDSKQFAEDAVTGKNDFLQHNAPVDEVAATAEATEALTLLDEELKEVIAAGQEIATALEAEGITTPTQELTELAEQRQAIEASIAEISNRQTASVVPIDTSPSAREANVQALEQFHQDATHGRRQKAQKLAKEKAKQPAGKTETPPVVDAKRTYSRVEIAAMDAPTRKAVMDAKLKTAKSAKHKQNIRNKYDGELNKIINNARKTSIKGKVADTLGDLNRMTTNALTPISTRLKRISPKLRAQLRRFEFNLAQQVNKDRKTAEPFLAKYSKLDDADRTVLDFAMKNGDIELVNEVAVKNDMVEEIAAVRQMLEEIYQRAELVGYEIGYRENFFPRHVLDHEGLVEHFENGEVGAEIMEAIQKKQLELGVILTTEEKAALINTLLRGYNTAQISLSKPSALKERNIDRVTAEINQFYDTSDQAIIGYISTVNEAVEARRFFGKKDKTKMADDDAARTKDMNDSIGFYVLKEMEAGNITAKQAKELGEILQARFNRGKMSQFWRVYKNISYIDTMGSPTSALTQIGDLGFAMYRNGVFRTLKVLPAAAKGKSEITREDVGVEKIAAEFEEGSKSAKAVEKIFKLVGLNKMDAIGKETLINGALDRYRQKAKKPSKSFRAELELIFEGETDSVLKDLREGTNSENVKLLLMNELMEFQPVALSEMPEAYLRMGNGRIFYMLKSFTIKQFDIYRNEVFDEIRSGNPVQGMKNLSRLLMFFVAANAGADFLKDLLLGRETPPEDYVVNNILRIMGVSKFQAYTARREGLGTAAGKTILPPFKFIDSVYKDANKAISKGIDPSDARTLTSVPVFGKLYYWWFGGGTKHGSKSNNNDSKKKRSDGKF